MKKLLAILLSMVLVFTLGTSAFATEYEAETPDINQEEILDPDTSEEVEEDETTDEEYEEDEEDFEEEEEERGPLTDEEIQQIRKENALAPIADVYESFTTNLVASLFLPVLPVALIVPVFGWIVSAAVLGAPFMVLLSPFKFIAACFEAVDIYVNFDASEYQSFAM